ncbi:phage tail length tape measure family protein [Stenotrophomonas nitritireducens]|uniref:Bacteriophage tail tape measure N-terminal domain-containing protein n=1 Tax=Stenotrophomonas nitritireducens TaxID=83617 RepID=A0ABR5NFF4_9GAMM|nr:phage tail length tape measure family protein [Stenotrophomonas nitritireducens]KRG53613.1 hypothetical protein ABB22_17385 [Stenotrophomonas nitritireducens]
MSNAQQPNLRVRFSADLNDIKQGFAALRSDVAALRREASKSVDLKGITDGIAQFRNVIGGLFAGVTVGSLFRSIITETRDASGEVAQLQAVLKSTGQQAGYTQQQLLDMSSSMSEATTHSAGEIVRAQTRLLSYTGIVGKQFPQALQMAIDQSARLGESIEQSAETIGKALDKPSQGVAALTKQGFKFTEQQKLQMKIMEATGRTAEAQQIVLDAMAESYAGAGAAARNTFGGALAGVGNALRDLVDGSGSGSLSSVISAINGVAAALASPEMKAAAAGLTDAVLQLVGGFARFVAQDGARYLRLLGEAAALTIKHIDLLAVAVGAYLAARGIAAAIIGVQALIKWLAAMRAALAVSAIAANGLKATLATMGGPITLALVALTTVLYELYQRTEQAKQAQDEHKRALKEVGDMSKYARDQAFEVAKAKREEALTTMMAAKAQLQAAKINARENVDAGRGGGNLLGLQSSSRASMNPALVQAEADAARAQKMLDEWDDKIFEILTSGIDNILKPVDAAVAETGKSIAKSNALMIDAIRRTMAELDALYGRGGISIAEYFSKRTALQQKSIDLEIEQARSELAITTEAAGRRRIEEQIVKLQRDRAEVATTAATEQKKAEEGLAQSLAEVKNRLLELDGKAGEAQRAQLENQYKALMQRLRAEGDATGQALVSSLIDRLVAKAKSDELRDALGKITSQLQGKETAIGAQVGAGMLGYGEGEAQLKIARSQALEQLRALRVAAVDSMQGLAKGSPEQAAAIAGLQEIDVQIAQVVQAQRVWQQKFQDMGAASLGDFFADMATRAKGFKDSFDDMVKGFVAGVARMVAQEAAMRALRSMFNFGGSGGGAAGGVMGWVSSLFQARKHHQGGLVGTGGTGVRIAISPEMLGSAPRFHDGGGFGLKADERVAVLQTGERVLSRRQTAAYDSAGSAGSMKVEIHNNGAPARVESAQIWRGADGEQLLKLFLAAAADDVASGGQIGRAGVARYGWSERL